MNYHCPNCEENLRWCFLSNRLAIKIFRKLKTENFTYAGICPNCGYSLGMKIHYSDVDLQKIMWGAILFTAAFTLSVYFFRQGGPRIILMISAIGCICFKLMLFIQVVQRNTPKPWRRYERDR